MRFTFDQLITKLIAAGAFPVDLDSEGQKSMVNEGLEAMILSGRWNGTAGVLSVNVADNGLLTLPRQFLTAKAVKVDGAVRSMASPWYSFLPGTTDISQWSTNIQDQGDGFCVFKQPKEAAQLRIASVGATDTVEVHGTDADGVEIRTGDQHGIVLTINDPKTGAYFTNVTEVIKPVTDRVATLYACYDDSTEEAIGIYEPGETVPDYRQYLIQEATLVNEGLVTPVQAFVQRRHIDLVADNDLVPIDNFRALKNAVRHVHFENEADEARSDKALENAIYWANQELKRLRAPGEVGTVRVNAMLSGATGLVSRR